MYYIHNTYFSRSWTDMNVATILHYYYPHLSWFCPKAAPKKLVSEENFLCCSGIHAFTHAARCSVFSSHRSLSPLYLLSSSVSVQLKLFAIFVSFQPSSTFLFVTITHPHPAFSLAVFSNLLLEFTTHRSCSNHANLQLTLHIHRH